MRINLINPTRMLHTPANMKKLWAPVVMVKFVTLVSPVSFFFSSSETCPRTPSWPHCPGRSFNICSLLNCESTLLTPIWLHKLFFKTLFARPDEFVLVYRLGGHRYITAGSNITYTDIDPDIELLVTYQSISHGFISSPAWCSWQCGASVWDTFTVIVFF